MRYYLTHTFRKVYFKTFLWMESIYLLDFPKLDDRQYPPKKTCTETALLNLPSIIQSPIIPIWWLSCKSPWQLLMLKLMQCCKNTNRSLSMMLLTFNSTITNNNRLNLNTSNMLLLSINYIAPIRLSRNRGLLSSNMAVLLH